MSVTVTVFRVQWYLPITKSVQRAVLLEVNCLRMILRVDPSPTMGHKRLMIVIMVQMMIMVKMMVMVKMMNGNE